MLNTAITAHFKWTAEEFIAAQRFALRHSPLTRRYKAGTVGWGSLALALGIAMLLLRNWHPMGFVLLLMGVAFLLVPFFTKQMLLKEYARRPDRDALVLYQFRPDLVIYETEHSRAEMAWTVFGRAIKSPGGFLLFVADREFHWLPKRAFRDTAEMDNFWQMVVDRVRQRESVR